MPVEATAPDCIFRNCIFEGITYSYAILLKASNTTFMGNTIEGGTMGPVFEASDAITCRHHFKYNKNDMNTKEMPASFGTRFLRIASHFPVYAG